MSAIPRINEHAVSSVVAGIHAEGAPADRAAHLLLRARHEVERRRPSFPSPPAGSQSHDDRRLSGADRYGHDTTVPWGWAAHHASGHDEWSDPELEKVA